MRLNNASAAMPVMAVSSSRTAIEAVSSKRDFDPMLYGVVGGATSRRHAAVRDSGGVSRLEGHRRRPLRRAWVGGVQSRAGRASSTARGGCVARVWCARRSDRGGQPRQGGAAVYGDLGGVPAEG